MEKQWKRKTRTGGIFVLKRRRSHINKQKDKVVTEEVYKEKDKTDKKNNTKNK